MFVCVRGVFIHVSLCVCGGCVALGTGWVFGWDVKNYDRLTGFKDWWVYI